MIGCAEYSLSSKRCKGRSGNGNRSSVIRNRPKGLTIPDYDMGDTLSLIPELEDVVQRGSRAKRREILQRMTALFLDGAGHYNVSVFSTTYSRCSSKRSRARRAPSFRGILLR